MKKIAMIIAATGVMAAAMTACNYESPQDKYKRECTEGGGTVRSNMEDDGEQVYYCVYPGESFAPGVDD